jgi:hypothetical protein
MSDPAKQITTRIDGGQLLIGNGRLDNFTIQELRGAIGDPDQVEEIPMHGGWIRFRDWWHQLGVSTLRDCETKLESIRLETEKVDISILQLPLPGSERQFAKCFPSATGEFGHWCQLIVAPWVLDVEFRRPIIGGKRTSTYVPAAVHIGLWAEDSVAA